MLFLLNVALTAISLALLIPIGVFCGQCALALLPRRRRPPETIEDRPTVAVLIPAHDEESVIGETLRALAPALRQGDRLVVVADNCTDRTAEIARQCGAMVLQRSDPERRGKGYALDFGIRHLASDPPGVLCVGDADGRMTGAAIDCLARQARATGRPAQAPHLIELAPGAGPAQALSALAVRFKALARTTGLARIGMPCHLMGAGMAFPWPIVQSVSWATGNVVEDKDLGIALALAGHPPLLCEDAVATSSGPCTQDAMLQQRTRWEHGHLQTAIRQVPRLLMAALRQRRLDLLSMALDLSVPPLCLLLVTWLAAIVAMLAAWLLGAAWLPAALLGAGALGMAAAVVGGWAVFCRRQVPLSVLAAAPLYVLRKLPIYAAFLVHRQQTWVRTEREPLSESQSLAP